VTAAAALYTQYYLGFLLVANAVPLIILRHWRELRSYLAGMVLTAVCFAPMAGIVPGQVSDHTQGTAASASAVEAARHVTSLVRLYSVQFEATSLRAWQTAVWGVVLVVVLLGLAVRFRRFFDRPRVALWTATATAALMFCALAQKTGVELAAERHFVGLFLPACLSTFAFLRAAARPAVAGWALLIVGVNLSTLAARYEPLAKRGDWRRVAEAIMLREQPSQPIVVFQGERVRPFRHHYRGRNVVVPLPPQAGEAVYDLNRFVLRSPAEIAAALQQAEPHHERIWLVRNGTGRFAGCDFHPEILDAFIEERYVVEETLEFFETQVRLFRRKPSLLTTSTAPTK
jgi:hypothetical protein